MNVQQLDVMMSGSLTAVAFVTALRHVSDFQAFTGPGSEVLIKIRAPGIES